MNIASSSLTEYCLLADCVTRRCKNCKSLSLFVPEILAKVFSELILAISIKSSSENITEIFLVLEKALYNSFIVNLVKNVTATFDENKTNDIAWYFLWHFLVGQAVYFCILFLEFRVILSMLSCLDFASSNICADLTQQRANQVVSCQSTVLFPFSDV